MEQWEIKLRAKLDKELPNGCYPLQIGNKIHGYAGKGGEIEFRVALEKEVRSWGMSYIPVIEKIEVPVEFSVNPFDNKKDLDAIVLVFVEQIKEEERDKDRNGIWYKHINPTPNPKLYKNLTWKKIEEVLKDIMYGKEKGNNN